MVENHDRLEDGDGDHLTTPGEKPRGGDGKFKAKEASAPKPKAEPATAKAPAGGLAEITKMVADGQIEDALKAIGLAPEGLTSKQWEAFGHQSRKARAAAEKREAEVREAHARVEQMAGGLAQRFGRFAEAEKAYQAGDLDRAMQLAFNEGFDAVNKRAIAQMANQDPRVSQIQAELQAERRQRELERQQWQQNQEAQRLEQAREQYVADLSSQLASLEDERITAAVEAEPEFVRRVFAIQAKHYRPASDSTIPTEEAAALALQEMEAEYARRAKIFGGGSPSPAVGGGKTASREGPTGRVSTVKPKTQLRTREAAEAHTQTPLRGKALMERYVRQAMAAQSQEVAAD